MWIEAAEGTRADYLNSERVVRFTVTSEGTVLANMTNGEDIVISHHPNRAEARVWLRELVRSLGKPLE